jgi:hypothetical protein
MTRRPRLFRNALVSLALWTSSAQAYNAQTHQDISAYAYELMVVASARSCVRRWHQSLSCSHSPKSWLPRLNGSMNCQPTCRQCTSNPVLIQA